MGRLMRTVASLAAVTAAAGAAAPLAAADAPLVPREPSGFGPAGVLVDERADAAAADGRGAYVTGVIGSSFPAAGGGVAGAAFGGEGALGVSIPRPAGAVRLEIEGRRRAALSGTRIGGDRAAVDGEWTTMANVWRDVSVVEHLALYAGGGLGVGGYSRDGDAAGPDAATRVTAFGWQAGGGAAYAITDRLTLDVGCRFYGLEPGAGEMLFAVRLADPFRRWLSR